MSAIRHLVRAAVVGIAVVVATGIGAAPAFAADASVQLTRLPTRMTAGGDPAPLVGSVKNTSRNQLGTIQVTFVIQMSGLDPEEVSVDGLRFTKQSNRLRATTQIEAPAPGRSKAISHQLQFLEGAPSGRATVTLAVSLRRGNSWRQVDSARTTTTVIEAPPTPSEEPSPEPTEEEPSAEPTEQPSTADSAGDDIAAVPRANEGAPLWPLYTLGLLLVAGGGGLVAMLLLRRNRDADVDQPAYAGGYGHTGYAEPAGYTGPAGYGSGTYPGSGGYPGPAGQTGVAGQAGVGAYPPGLAGAPTGEPYPPGAYAPSYEPPTAVMPEAPTTIMPPVPGPPTRRSRGGRHRSED
ncbi:MAG: DUF3824 domain-containing protein [Micromonosporaceae bacterium]